MTNQEWTGPHASILPPKDSTVNPLKSGSSGTSSSSDSIVKPDQFGASGLHVPELNDEVILGNATKKDVLQGPETRLQWTKRVLTEGHTFTDALLTVTAAQIGQVLLTMPNAFYKTGLTAGLISSLVSMILSVWTMYLLAALFLERKRDLIKAGQWYNADGVRKRVSQYHEVIQHHMGSLLRWIAQIVIILSLGGTSLAQIIACSGDSYVVHKSLSKRTWALIWGAVLMIFAFVPTFRHFRVLNVIALIGTSYTAAFIAITAIIKGRSPAFNAGKPPISVQGYFNGAAVLVNALGGHSLALEMMDSMRNQKGFVGAMSLGWVWCLLLTIPHSVAVNFAYPLTIGKNDNVFGVLPVNKALDVAVWLMVVHQFVAFALYLTPLLFMVEKLVGVHEKKFIWRVPVRLPVALLIYVLGVMLPFYSSINSFMGAVGAPLIAFVIPSLSFNWVYRSKEKRANSPYPPFWPFNKWGWKVAMGLNWVIMIGYLGFFGGAAYYAILAIVQNSNTFGVFAECYQCPPGWQAKLHG